jgi:hypothetical protein
MGMLNDDFVIPMALDEESLGERAEPVTVLLEKSPTLLGNSHITLRQEDVVTALGESGRRSLEIRLKLFVHPGEGVDFHSLKLTFEFDANPTVLITKIDPERIQGSPTEITVKRKVGIKPKELEFGTEHSAKYTTAPDMVFGSIMGTSGATFEFFAPKGEKLRVNQNITLCLEYALDNSSVIGWVTVRGKMQANGLRGLIPVWGRKDVNFLRSFTAS